MHKSKKADLEDKLYNHIVDIVEGGSLAKETAFIMRATTLVNGALGCDVFKRADSALQSALYSCWDSLSQRLVETPGIGIVKLSTRIWEHFSELNALPGSDSYYSDAERFFRTGTDGEVQPLFGDAHEFFKTVVPGRGRTFGAIAIVPASVAQHPVLTIGLRRNGQRIRTSTINHSDKLCKMSEQGLLSDATAVEIPKITDASK